MKTGLQHYYQMAEYGSDAEVAATLGQTIEHLERQASFLRSLLLEPSMPESFREHVRRQVDDLVGQG